MQKMNEYFIQRENQRHDSLQQGNKTSLTKSKTKKGPYSKDFTKVNYRDDDMRRLATTGQGTTSAYNYQDFEMTKDLRTVDKAG